MKNLVMVAVMFSALSGARAANSLPAVPRFDGLGRHHHPITTKWQLAQRYFDQGLTLCFNFNHAEAVRSFEAAAMVDTNCAMAWWGVAFALGPNINAPMFEDAVPKAWDALQKAIVLKEKASAKERDYIDALAKRYAKEPMKDRSALDDAFAVAMRSLAKKYPDDLDAQTLFAESLMDTSPWNYWQEDLTPKPSAKEALEVIESVLARVKAHSGADHLYIHLVEAGPHAEKGVPSADRIGKLTPKAGHLVHMASHIYVRVGRYHDASRVNERASEADEKYLNKVKPIGVYPGGYYPHNLHFLWYATELEGRSKDSIGAAKEVSKYTLDLRCGAIEGPRQRYLPLLAYTRFGRWAEVLKEPLPSEEYPFDRAMAHYARARAFAAQGRVSDAEREFVRFQELEKSERVRMMDNPYFPGTKILAVAQHVIAGKIAGASNQPEEMVKQFRAAVNAERALSYMEPPYWHYAAKLSLGAALLKAGQSAEAESVFRETLKRDLPANGWPLYGLEQSLRAQGKDTEAKQVAKEFKKAWKHADTKLDLAWF
jgi:tetratricopeptide (TPR) repeat protein